MDYMQNRIQPQLHSALRSMRGSEAGQGGTTNIFRQQMLYSPLSSREEGQSLCPMVTQLLLA